MLRREHPGWGPRSIGHELAKEGVVPLPGRSSTIGVRSVTA
jgi:hypothetical protein